MKGDWLLGFALVTLIAVRCLPLPPLEAEPEALESLTQADLLLLPGIGPVKAEALLLAPHGDWRSVRGVGPVSRERLQPFLTLPPGRGEPLN